MLNILIVMEYVFVDGKYVRQASRYAGSTNAHLGLCAKTHAAASLTLVTKLTGASPGPAPAWAGQAVVGTAEQPREEGTGTLLSALLVPQPWRARLLAFSSMKSHHFKRGGKATQCCHPSHDRRGETG